MPGPRVAVAMTSSPLRGMTISPGRAIIRKPRLRPHAGPPDDAPVAALDVVAVVAAADRDAQVPQRTGPPAADPRPSPLLAFRGGPRR